jgi:hypothetical protein
MLAHLKPDIEGCYIPFSLLSQLKHKLASTISEDTVPVILQDALPLGSVWLSGVNLVSNGVIEVKLRRKLITLLGYRRGANFEVDMDGSAPMPPGIDRHKLSSPINVCYLIPT